MRRRFMFFLLVFSILLLALTSCPLITTFILTIEKDGNGNTDPTVGVHKYKKDTVVTVKAFPDVGWEFGGWEGEVASNDATVTTTTMDKSKTIKARFVEIDEIGKIIDKIDPATPYTLRFVEELIPLVGTYLDSLLDLLDSTDYLERWAAAFALQRSDLDEDTLDDLETYLDDPEAAIRALIAVAFLRNGDDRGKETLEDLLGDTRVMVFSKPPVLLGDFALSMLQVYFPIEYPASAIYWPETTSVTGGPCDYTVTVNIAFHGDGATQQLLDSWEASAEAIWNGPNGSQEWKDCCTVTFDFVFTLLEEGEEPPDDAHVIEVKDVKAAHTSYVNTPLPTPGSTETTTGTWDNLDTPAVVAHEIGHLMGLDDEYHYDEDDNYVNDNVQSTDPQSIMAQTWGKVSALPDHISAIMALADIQCECDYSMTITPAYDVNVSPGTHTVEVAVTKADGKPAKGLTVTFTVIGNPNIDDTDVTTDDEGKASFTYSRDFCYTNEDEIEAWAKCNADAMALKQWISLSWIEPDFWSPYDHQRDYPYSTPLVVIFETEPEAARGAENLEYRVKIFYGGEEIFSRKGRETSVETGLLLEPGHDYEIEITPISGPPETEGTPSRITFTTAPATPEYLEPPEDIEVDMAASDTGIRSSEFAKMIEDTIVKAGYKSMTFLFSQCYGGGMFKDLDHLDNTLLKSAARWNELAYDCFLWSAPDDRFLCWLDELRKAIENDRTIAHADDDALRNDPIGPFRDPPDPFGRVEHPQGLYNGDQFMKLTDDASSKHALIFSGDDEPGFVDADRWETTLTSTPFGFEVTKISGGTKKDLQNALETIAESMNENEVFIFIFTGHGSAGQRIAEEVEIPAEGVDKEFTGSLDLLDILQAINREFLYLTVDMPPVGEDIKPYGLLINELPVGVTDPTIPRNIFEIPLEFVNWGALNTLTLMPLEVGTDSHKLYELFLDTGRVPYGECGCD